MGEWHISSLSPGEKKRLELSDPTINEDGEGLDAEAVEILNDASLEPGKKETLASSADTSEIDKWIGRGLKLPNVQDDGHW